MKTNSKFNFLFFAILAFSSFVLSLINDNLQWLIISGILLIITNQEYIIIKLKKLEAKSK